MAKAKGNHWERAVGGSITFHYGERAVRIENIVAVSKGEEDNIVVHHPLDDPNGDAEVITPGWERASITWGKKE